MKKFIFSRLLISTFILLSTYSFNWINAQSIEVVSPNGGEIWQAGSIQNITWTSSGNSGNVLIEYSVNNGTDWLSVITSTVDAGTFSWTVPENPSTECLIRVSDVDLDPADISNAAFTISPDYRKADSLVLVDIYNTMNGPNWDDNTNWLTGNLDTWAGVTLTGNRVTNLDLENNNLSGTIPLIVVNLDQLTNLDLGGNGLTGNIPPEIAGLTNLTGLHFQVNELTGSIPVEITTMTNLTGLYLSNNNLTGTIPPELGNLTNLTRLFLYNNDLDGPIPTEFGNLVNLNTLQINSNQLSGRIPSSLGALTQMDDLRLHSNQLEGAVPTELNNLTIMTQLTLANNQLDTLPDLSGLTSLETLTAENNLFTFEDIEPNIGVPSLTFTYSPQGTVGETLVVEIAQGDTDTLVSLIEGSNNTYEWYKDGALIPGEVDDSLILTTVSFSDAGNYTYQVSNTLATDLTLYSEPIQVIILDTTKVLTPQNLTALPDNEQVTLRWDKNPETNLHRYEIYRDISSPATTLIGSVIATTEAPDTNYIDLGLTNEQNYYYRIRGIDSLNNYSNYSEEVSIAPYDLLADSLALVALYNSTDGANWTDNTNWLTGTIDTWNGVTVTDGRVTLINLGGNNLTGTIPAEIGNLTKLDRLDLGPNNLTGGIPIELTTLTSLTGLLLDGNDLDGTIPPEIGNLINLTTLYLTGNEFTGGIPAEIGNLINLTRFYAYGNNLEGALPSEIGNLVNLTHLRLNGNDFTGPIPAEIGNLVNLQLLHLSYNLFTGAVPSSLANCNLITELRLESNALEDLPNLGALTALTTLTVHNNQFSFEDIEPNLGVASTTFTYSPQAATGEAITVDIDLGATDSLIMVVGGDNNTYQWFKDGSLLSGEENDTLILETVDFTDGGIYTCEIGNTLATELTLISLPVEVNIIDITAVTSPQNIIAIPDDEQVTLHWDKNPETNLHRYEIYRDLTSPATTLIGSVIATTELPDTNFLDLGLTNEQTYYYRLRAIDSLDNISLYSTEVSITPYDPLGDSLALVALYNATDGANWTDNTNWLTGNMDTWYGITVTDGRVTQVILDNNGLSGSIPSEMGNIFRLERLDLGANDLSGNIPVEIASLTNLTGLLLDDNGLTGNIPPELGNLINLTTLYLTANAFDGIIPPELGNLINLTRFYAYGNNLTGSIPVEIGNLTNLTHLRLNGNDLTGSIPAEIGNLVNLQLLHLNYNLLNGVVPSSLENCNLLTELRLDNNNLEELPDLSALTALVTLTINDNQFSFEDIEPNLGVASTTFTYDPQAPVGEALTVEIDQGDSDTLAIVVGGVNNIYQWYKDGAPMASEVNDTLFLDTVSFDDAGTYTCQINNTLATDLTLYSLDIEVVVLDTTKVIAPQNLTAIAGNEQVILSWNKNPETNLHRYEIYRDETSPASTFLTSVIATTALPDTNYIDLGLTNDQTYYYRIRGVDSLDNFSYYSSEVSITPYDPVADSLALVALYNATDGANWTDNSNWLTGTLDTWAGVTMTDGRVTDLYLEENNLVGTIPTELGTMGALEGLDLSGNSLIGSIPPELGNLSSLTELHLVVNDLTGSIPVELGNLTNLTGLYLSNNELTGAIPAELGDLTNLTRVFLYSNQLDGTIPTELSNLVNLTTLRLNSNQLTGTIPAGFANFPNMDVLRLHTNQLSGEVPAGLNALSLMTELTLANNNLDILPDLSALTNLVTLTAENNAFTFEDIEPNLGIASTIFSYSPQDSVGSAQHVGLALGVDYTLSVTVGGANNVYQWYKDNVLIPGAEAASYELTGVTPADDGVYTCSISNTVATDLTLFSRPITIEVAEYISILTPNGGEFLEVGSSADITWNSNGTSGDVHIEYSVNNGTDWNDVIASTTDDGAYTWTVPDEPSANCLIRVSDTDGAPTDETDALFSIVTPQTLTISAPNGGETWDAESVQEITWSATATSGTVSIAYSTNNGADWSEIISSTSDLGTYNWTLPLTSSTECLVRVSDTDGYPSDISDGVFEITIPNSILDSLALVALYNSTDGANWTDHTNWLVSDQSIDTWFGVTLSGDRVSSIVLNNNNLTGTIPSEFNDLSAITEVDLSGNVLNELPDLSGLITLSTLSVENNQFTFEDIEPNLGIASTTFTYAPQDSVGAGGLTVLTEGTDYTLSVTVGGANNTYQWYKDEVLITGAEASSYELIGVSAADEGNYTCQISNTLATDLTLYSRIETIQVNAAAVTPPVIGNMMISSSTDLTFTLNVVAGATGYNVYRDTYAGFTPDNAGGSNRIATGITDEDLIEPGVQWTDPGVIGDAGTNYYYIFTAVNGIESDNSAVVGEFDYNLITTATTDFNEISLALNVPGIQYASDLLALIPNCNSVARWNAATQGYDQYLSFLPPSNFEVFPGHPYYVNISGDATFTLLGEPASPSFNLITTPTTDFNEIMLPLDRTDITNASELLAAIPECNSVARWNAGTQGYDQYLPFLPPSNFDVHVGYAYYINVNADVTWPATGGRTMFANTEKENSILSTTSAPHTGYGEIEEFSSAVNTNQLHFKAYIQGRPDEILTETSAGSILANGYWAVQCAGFTSGWNAGEILEVDFFDNSGTKISKAQIVLTYAPADKAEAILLSVDSPLATLDAKAAPNPFIDRTGFSYSVDSYGPVSISIYSAEGKLIKSILNDHLEPGSYSNFWDGTNNKNSRVSNGIYLLILQTNEGTINERIIYSGSGR